MTARPTDRGPDDGDAGSDGDLDALIARADLDGLIRLVDAHCATQSWERLDRLRLAARAAVHTGRQLWPAATLAAYRLALRAPAVWAVRALDGDAGRFVPGPLTEVIAQHHTYAELADLLPPGPEAAFVAHERALRGERIDPAGLMDVLEIPFSLAPWEPAYPLAQYGDEGGRFESPALPADLRAVDVGSVRADPHDVARGDGGDSGAEVIDALRALVEPWVTQSNGRADVVCTAGAVPDALGALGLRSARAARIDPAVALAWLAWAGASGAAHGRRRGAATGRFGVWWLLGALGGASQSWPLRPEDAGTLVDRLGWWWWDAGDPPSGWNLQIAVEDPQRGLSWAITAHDAV